MITIECRDCRNIVGHAYSLEDEGNRTIDYIDDPVKVATKLFIRCKKCYAKFQQSRPDLSHTHLVTDVR